MINEKLKKLPFKAEIYAGGLYAHCLLRGCWVQNLFGIAEHTKTTKTIAKQNHVEHKRSRKTTSPKNALDRELHLKADGNGVKCGFRTKAFQKGRGILLKN
jgi:hypothetical protein